MSLARFSIAADKMVVVLSTVPHRITMLGQPPLVRRAVAVRLCTGGASSRMCRVVSK
jgi:hypothetical protein